MSAAGRRGIRIRSVAKRYGSTVALDGIELDIRPGEVLGIAGPNGAGKSDADPHHRRRGAARFGHPHLRRPALVPDASTGSRSPSSTRSRSSSRISRSPRTCWSAARARAPAGRGLGIADAGVMEALGIARLEDRILDDCTLATQQRTEIARAVAREARVFLFDEPNSALTDEESDELFREMHKLAGEGRIVLLVTHRLGDLVAHAARVAVIRDGTVRKVIGKDALTEEAIAEQLVVGTGRRADAAAPKASPNTGREMLRVVELVASQRVRMRSTSPPPMARSSPLMGVEGVGRPRAAALVRRARALQRLDPHRRRRGRRGGVPQHRLRARDAPGEPLFELLGRREPGGAPRHA